MATDIDQFDVKPGAIVVLRGEFPLEAIEEISEQLLERGASFILLMAPDQSIEQLDEDDMRAAGWVRVTDETQGGGE